MFAGHPVVVPQEMYSTFRPYTAFAAITFCENGSLGVRLGHAFHNELHGLEESQAIPVLTNTAQKVTIRINVSVFDLSMSNASCISPIHMTVAGIFGVVGCHARLQPCFGIKANHETKACSRAGQENQSVSRRECDHEILAKVLRIQALTFSL